MVANKRAETSDPYHDLKSGAQFESVNSERIMPVELLCFQRKGVHEMPAIPS